MARAGYDPREMAHMFRTIQQQGGGGGPELLSDHPNPGQPRAGDQPRSARCCASRGAARAASCPRFTARLNQMPQAPTTEQVARRRVSRAARCPGQSRVPVGTNGRNAAGRGAVAAVADLSARRLPAHQRPGNWEQVNGGNTVMFVPDGGYVRADNGQSAFTHGIEIGVTRGDGNLQQQTEQLVQGFAQSNPQLRRQGGYSRTTIGGRQGLTTTLSNVSEVTGDSEAVNVSTVQLRDGSVLFLIGVAPEQQARTYSDDLQPHSSERAARGQPLSGVELRGVRP